MFYQSSKSFLKGLFIAGLLVSWNMDSAEAARRRSYSADEESGQEVRSGGRYSNPLFFYTHLIPSPYTLPAGVLSFGTSVAFGITDFFQVGTDLLRDFYQMYNVNGKLSLIDYPEFALGLTLGFETYNWNDIDSNNPDFKVTSWQPGVTTAFGIAPNLAWFIAGHLNFTQSVLNTSGVKTSGLAQGAGLSSDLSYAYNPERGGVGNVLSAGVSYDVTYEIFGLGISHHWPGFHLGFHYYPNADKLPFQPIIAGGGTVEL